MLDHQHPDYDKHGKNLNNDFIKQIMPKIKEKGYFRDSTVIDIEHEKNNSNGLIKQMLSTMDYEHGIDYAILHEGKLKTVSARSLKGDRKFFFTFSTFKCRTTGENTEIDKKIRNKDIMSSYLTISACKGVDGKVARIGIIKTKQLVEYYEKYKDDATKVEHCVSRVGRPDGYCKIWWKELKKEYDKELVLI